MCTIREPYNRPNNVCILQLFTHIYIAIWPRMLLFATHKYTFVQVAIGQENNMHMIITFHAQSNSFNNTKHYKKDCHSNRRYWECCGHC